MPTKDEPDTPAPIPEPAELRKNERSWIEIAREAAAGKFAKSDIEYVPIWRTHPEGEPTLLMHLPIQPLGDTDIDQCRKEATPIRMNRGRPEPGEIDQAQLRLRLLVRATAPEARDGLFGDAAQKEFGVDDAWKVAAMLFRAGEAQQVAEAIDRTSSYLAEDTRKLLGN